jgi:hypothetical protein
MLYTFRESRRATCVWLFAIGAASIAINARAEDLPIRSDAPNAAVREEGPKGAADFRDDSVLTLDDPAFGQHVDLKRLGNAYLTSDAQSLIDIGLQLQEGELILQRSHQYFRSAQILDVALRLATASNDTESLERLENAAKRTGNQALAQSVAVSRQLSGQQRVVMPPLPEPSETLLASDVAQVEDLVRRFDKARAIGNREALNQIQSQLKKLPLEKGEFRSYIEKELAEALANVAEPDNDALAGLRALENLSGESRGLSGIQLSGISLVTKVNGTDVKRKGYFLDVEPFRLNTDTNMITVVNKGKVVPKASLEGLRTRYGTLFVNYGAFYEIQLDAKGNALIQNGQTVRAFPRRQIVLEPGKEEQVTVYERRPEGGWFKAPSITFAEAVSLALEMPDGSAGPAAFGATPLVAVSGGVQLPERMVALFSNMTFKELNTMGFGATTLSQINDAKGGTIKIPPNGIDPALYEKASKMPDGPTVANIVSAGGGNIMIAQIAAAPGGGGIVVSGGGNLTADGAVGSMAKAADAINKTTVWDQGKSRIVASDYIVNRFGKSIKSQDVGLWAQFLSVKPGKAGEIINPPANLANGNPFFANAKIIRTTDF